jgi:hypothetical protein
LTTLRVKKKQRRRRRKKKLRYLRRRLEETKNHGDRQRLIAKIHRVSPRAPLPDG